MKTQMGLQKKNTDPFGSFKKYEDPNGSSKNTDPFGSSKKFKELFGFLTSIYKKHNYI
jgi:hypothetical protein